MDTLGLSELVRRRLALVLVAVIMAAIASGAVALMSPVKYQARAVLWLSHGKQETGSSGLDYNSLMMYRQLARSYGELATSSPILEKLSMQVKNSPGASELRKMVSIRKVKDLEMLEVVVTDTNPERAAYLANSLAVLLQQEEKDVWKMNNLRLIAPAVADGRPSGPNLVMIMSAAALAGLFGSLLILAILDYRWQK